MDIAAAQASAAMTEVGLRVVRKQRDAMQQEGEAAVALIQAAAQVQAQQQSKPLAAPGRVDTYA
jgi:hypothetical protein